MRALVFGYKQNPNGLLHRQCKRRCDTAIRQYRSDVVTKIYLVSAVNRFDVSQAFQMRDYLISHGVPTKDIIVDEKALNTAGELDIFARLVPANEPVMLISTWYHLPRIIWLALWRFNRSCFSVSPSWWGSRLSDVLIEPIKMVNAILRPWRSAKVLKTTPVQS